MKEIMKKINHFLATFAQKDNNCHSMMPIAPLWMMSLVCIPWLIEKFFIHTFSQKAGPFYKTKDAYPLSAEISEDLISFVTGLLILLMESDNSPPEALLWRPPVHVWARVETRSCVPPISLRQTSGGREPPLKYFPEFTKKKTEMSPRDNLIKTRWKRDNIFGQTPKKIQKEIHLVSNKTGVNPWVVLGIQYWVVTLKSSMRAIKVKDFSK